MKWLHYNNVVNVITATMINTSKVPINHIPYDVAVICHIVVDYQVGFMHVVVFLIE